MYRTCLSLQAGNQYLRARNYFYDAITWFSPIFDEAFVTRSNEIVKKYSSPEYKDRYTFDQIEQLKLMRITTEFTRMLMDATSRNRVQINRDPTKRCEMIPVGFGQIVSYENMTAELFSKLSNVQKFRHPREVYKFFNHTIGWFGGIFDAKFVMQGYLISQTEASPEMRYRKLLISFTKMLSRKSITVSPYVTLAYKPSWDAPKSVDEVVSAKSISSEVKETWLPDFTM